MVSNSASSLPVLLSRPRQTLISFPILAVPCLSNSSQIVHLPLSISNFCSPRRVKHIRFSAPLFLASKKIYMAFPRRASLLGSPSLPPFLASSRIQFNKLPSFFDSLILPLCLVPFLHPVSTILSYSRKPYLCFLFFPALYKQIS